MKIALPIIGLVLILALAAYFAFGNDDDSGDTTPLADEDKSVAKSDIRPIDNKSSSSAGKSTPSKTLSEKTRVERHNAEETHSIDGGAVEEPEEVAVDTPQPETPKVTPQRATANHFMKALSESVSASEFCAAPFFFDGKGVEATLDKVQNMLNKAGEKAANGGYRLEVSKFESMDAKDVATSDSEDFKKLLKNKTYVALRDHALAHGGHVAIMHFEVLVGEKVVDDGESMIMAFNKEGKLIGFKD